MATVRQEGSLKFFMLPERYADPSVRAELMRRLMAEAIWKRVGGGSEAERTKGTALSFLIDKPSRDIARITRLETFFGKTLGDRTHDGQTIPETILDKYQRNDSKASSENYGWALLDAFASDLKPAVIDRLCELLTVDRDIVKQYLQCNVNLYAPAAELSAHRDDKTLTDEDTGRFISTTQTFFPAALTCVLEGEWNSHEFEVIYCSTCGDGNATNRDACTSRNHDLIYDHSAQAGCLFYLVGADYTHGVHTIRQCEKPSKRTDSITEHFTRMSLNFRVVRPETWALFY
ncbi:MAG: hypothetical protein IAI50_09305 [Candidatus Eremiobacteraeota bacterium]|nr:hypothetical protein [Candidatus Eremiobacteraeota bacterium]